MCMCTSRARSFAKSTEDKLFVIVTAPPSWMFAPLVGSSSLDKGRPTYLLLSGGDNNRVVIQKRHPVKHSWDPCGLWLVVVVVEWQLAIRHEIFLFQREPLVCHKKWCDDHMMSLVVLGIAYESRVTQSPVTDEEASFQRPKKHRQRAKGLVPT